MLVTKKLILRLQPEPAKATANTTPAAVHRARLDMMFAADTPVRVDRPLGSDTVTTFTDRLRQRELVVFAPHIFAIHRAVAS